MYRVSFRPIWEGGQYKGDEIKRREALRLALELGADYIDIELKVVISIGTNLSLCYLVFAEIVFVSF